MGKGKLCFLGLHMILNSQELIHITPSPAGCRCFTPDEVYWSDIPQSSCGKIDGNIEAYHIGKWFLSDEILNKIALEGKKTIIFFSNGHNQPTGTVSKSQIPLRYGGMKYYLLKYLLDRKLHIVAPDLVTQFLVKITFLYELVAKKLDFVLSKLQISIWKDRATVAW